MEHQKNQTVMSDHLIKPIEQFKAATLEQIQRASELLQRYQYAEERDNRQARMEITEWEEETIAMLDDHFTKLEGEHSAFATFLLGAEKHNQYLGNLPDEEAAAKLMDNLAVKHRYLQHRLGMILACEGLQNPDNPVLQSRAHLSKEQVKALITEKFSLFDKDFSYSVAEILEGCGVRMDDEQIKEMVNELVQEGKLEVEEIYDEIFAKIVRSEHIM